MSRRIEIDTLRGIACFLLVSFHVIGDTGNVGLQINDGWVRVLNDNLAYIRMPLFTFLSGYVYGLRPFAHTGYHETRTFITKKARRLLLPMLSLGTLFAFIQYYMPGTNSHADNLFMIHILPVAHFWFVESLFILFLFIVVMEYFSVFSSFFKCLIVFSIFCFIYVYDIEVNYFSISGVFYMAPYFLIGMVISRYKINYTSVKFGLFFSIIMVALVYFLLNSAYAPEKHSLFALSLGCVGCLTVLSFQLKNEFIAKIGFYSYSIYLLHVFFTAGSRISLKVLHVDSLFILYLCSLLLGIFGPIVVELTLKRPPKYVRMTLLGKSL